MRRSSWERVTEREELVGRLSAVSRLPQYLDEETSAKDSALIGGTGFMSLLYDGNVHWSVAACSIDPVLSHCQLPIFDCSSTGIRGDVCELRASSFKDLRLQT